MNYLGLDQSLTCTGYAVLIENTVYYGTIPTSARLLRERRIQMILDKISELREKFKPKIIFTEYVYRSAPLLKLEACIHQDLFRADQDFVIVKPKNWTESLGAAGTKKEFQLWLSKFTETKFRNTDESDAIGVLLGGIVNSEIMELDFNKLSFVPECPEKKVRRGKTRKGKRSASAA